MVPVIGNVLMGLCSGALFWAATRLGRPTRDREEQRRARGREKI